MQTAATVIFTSLLVFTLPAPAQDRSEAADVSVYRVELSIRDGSETSAKAGRHYTLLVNNKGKSTLNAGHKVPYATGSANVVGSPQLTTQYAYLDTGVNIDCRLREMLGKVVLNLDIDVSVIAQPDKAAPSSPNPTVASIRMAVNAMVNAGKPTVVASIDDPVTTRRFDVEATVTKVN